MLLAQSWWEDRVLRGVADYASTHNWELECRMRWTHQVPKAGEWRGDGIIAYAGVSGPMLNMRRKLLALVRSAGVPVVETADSGSNFATAQVVIPHVAIGRMAAEYFLGLNFRDVGYVTFADNLIERERQRGFQRTVEAAGCAFHALTARTLASKLARLPKPMGLFAANDPNALEVVFMCRDAGFSVPEVFAVMGVDDSEILCDLAAVPLTSINCNFERQGYEAAALLDRLMDGKPAPREAVVVAPQGVVVRRSTDTIAIPDLEAAKVLRFLRDHFREQLTVQQMVQELGIPRRRVHTVFCRHVGRTMLQELTRLRVEHARKRLVDRRLKVEAIGFESGFANRFHFVEAFKRVTGKTPQAYRRGLDAAATP